MNTFVPAPHDTHTVSRQPSAGAERVFVVIPAFNEAPVIREVVAALKREFGAVVVVDDGSTDGTAAEAIIAGAKVITHALNRGQGAALQTGLEFALRAGAAYVVTFDADGQHDVADVPRLLEPLRNGEADIALGSRFLGNTEGMSLQRRALLRAAILFTRLLSGVRLTDTHNGLRAFSRRAAGRIRLTQDRMAHASELIDQVSRTGLPVVEVPVHVRYTAYSRAKGQHGYHSFHIAFDYLVGRILR